MSTVKSSNISNRLDCQQLSKTKCFLFQNGPKGLFTADDCVFLLSFPLFLKMQTLGVNITCFHRAHSGRLTQTQTQKLRVNKA